MKTIGFIGLGLIGGSIAKAIRKFHPDYHLLAYDQNRDTLAAAVGSNIIDGVCEDKDSRFGTCDYVFLCAPVEFNIEYLSFLTIVLHFLFIVLYFYKEYVIIFLIGIKIV